MKKYGHRRVSRIVNSRMIMNRTLPEDSLLAAIDLGSNSFHLAIARLDHGEVRRVDSI